MSHLKQLIHEIHRRSLWQVLGIYLAGSWLALQAADTLTASLGLPNWVPQLALVLLIVLFPVVVATAFVQEGVKPTGQKRRPKGLSEELAEPPGDAPVDSSQGGLCPLGFHRNVYTVPQSAHLPTACFWCTIR